MIGGDVTPTSEPGKGSALTVRLPVEAAGWPLWKVIKEAGWVTSTSEARRLIQGGGVEVDGVRATSIEQSTSPGRHTVKLGKRRINQLVIDAPRV